MSFLLPKLTSKKEVDQAIKSTAEKVLVLRFGRDEDPVCLQLDDVLSKTSSDLSKMAAIYLVDVDQTPVYTQYFDISYIPSTVFFFNGQHMKVDYGRQKKKGGQRGPEEDDAQVLPTPSLPVRSQPSALLRLLSGLPSYGHGLHNEAEAKRLARASQGEHQRILEAGR
ncbi:thioredoxin-like protein 4B isoform X1 [Callithrix jacchus]